MKTLVHALLLSSGLFFGTSGLAASILEDDLELGESTEEDYLAGGLVTKHFLIVGTFRTYRGAERAAAELVHPTGLHLESEELEIHEGEPSYPRHACELSGWEYPCYVARGRFDDGAYLSVEPSDAYTGMKPGYFVVIAASGSRGDALAEQSELRSRGVPSYISTSQVWLGCIH